MPEFHGYFSSQKAKFVEELMEKYVLKLLFIILQKVFNQMRDYFELLEELKSKGISALEGDFTIIVDYP